MNDHQHGAGTPAEIDAADAAGDATVGEPSTGSANAGGDRVAQLERERDEHYDRLLRVTADFENYRKRTERERREISERAAASILEELLPIVDDFERALSAEIRSAEAPYREGVAIIHRQLTDLLHRRGVRPIEAVGADFDPRFHQAVAYEAVPGHRDGEVVEELRRGYSLGERLLRPSMVKVAKA